MSDESDGGVDRLGVECVIVGCDASLVSLRDGWPSTTRDGPVCADCWDYNNEHGHFPDEEPEHEPVTDGGRVQDGDETDQPDTRTVATPSGDARRATRARAAGFDPDSVRGGDAALRDGALAVEVEGERV